MPTKGQRAAGQPLSPVNEKDHAALKRAIRAGKIEARFEEEEG